MSWETPLLLLGECGEFTGELVGSEPAGEEGKKMTSVGETGEEQGDRLWLLGEAMEVEEPGGPRVLGNTGAN